ncbi:hypothetical protein [Enterocloster bolteae]|uniref:hypothetical protein n=1 Tax=Enterocloster bolteae TaxID=208479 RepID=UPI0028DCE202|nr:hypothetical protein [Enterocloster bolteae]
MGWLIQMLLEAVREQCSQFIVDMMEIVNQVFTELLSCNLDLFEELFSVVKDLYREAIVPLAIAILLLIFIWQLLKGMFGKYLNTEDPMELVIRSCICLFMVTGAKSIVNYILKVAGTPYDWVTGTHITVVSFADFTSVAEAVTAGLGIDSLNIQILMVIIQFMVAWNYLKLLFIMAERYVLLGVFSYTAPLAFATGGSKATNNILASWSKMFGGQVVLIILDAWCLKVYLSGYGNMMASGYGFTKFFAATLCLVGFGKIAFKLDSYMASLGVNLGRTSPGMGGLGVMMMLGRVFSRFGGNAGGHGAPAGGKSGPAAGAGKMASGVGSPIPMGSPGSSSFGKNSWGANQSAMAGNGADMGVPSSGHQGENVQEPFRNMPKDSNGPDNAFGADVNVPSYQDDLAASNDNDFMKAGEADENMGFGMPPGEEYMEGPFSGDMDYGTMNSGMDDEHEMMAAANGDGIIDPSGTSIEAGPFGEEGGIAQTGDAGSITDYGGIDDSAMTDGMSMLETGAAFDDENAAVSFDSGYQGMEVSDSAGDYIPNSSSVADGSGENGILPGAGIQGISGQEADVSAGVPGQETGAGAGTSGQEAGMGTGISGNASVLSQTGMMAEAGGGMAAPSGAAGSAGAGSGMAAMEGIQESGTVSGRGLEAAGRDFGTVVPDNQNYQQLERDGMKYARFAADVYEKPDSPHRVVKADGKKFYEVKMEPVQSGIRTTIQKDGKVHYEKTYKEVLPAVPKRKQKAAEKKENPSGSRTTKGKSGTKKNKGR